MKKTNLTILTILSILIFTSCGDKSSSTPTTPAVLTAGTLTITTTTSSTDVANPSTGLNTEFGPFNYNAIWIEDSKGKFVKTLYITLAGDNPTKPGVKLPSRRSWLTEWTLKSATNTVDAKTGATAINYGTLSGTWDGKDVTGNIVADGTYTLRMELADDQNVANGGAGISSKFTANFTKGTTTTTITAPNVTSFSSNTIKWTPAAQ